MSPINRKMPEEHVKITKNIQYNVSFSLDILHADQQRYQRCVFVILPVITVSVFASERIERWPAPHYWGWTSSVSTQTRQTTCFPLKTKKKNPPMGILFWWFPTSEL